MKEAINHVFGDKQPGLWAEFPIDTRKWPPWAIENHLWSPRGLLAKLQAQVSLSNNDTEPATTRRKLFMRGFYIFSVDISLKISPRTTSQNRHEDRMGSLKDKPLRALYSGANLRRIASIIYPSSNLKETGL